MARGQNEVRFTANVDDFHSGISRMKADIEKFANGSKDSVNSLGGAIGKFANVGKNGISSIVGSIGSMVPAFAAAMGAAEAFSKTINATQSTQDTFGRLTAQMNAGLELFFQKLATGDIGNFIRDIHSATEEARELYNVLDNLGSLELRSNFAISMLEAQRDIYQLRLKDKALSDEERKNAAAQLDLYNKRIAAMRGNLGQEQINAGLSGINSIIHSNTGVIGNSYIQDGFSIPRQGYDPKSILENMAKNIKLSEEDILRYCEEGADAAQMGKAAIDRYIQGYMDLARQYSSETSMAQKDNILKMEAELRDDFVAQFKDFPSMLIAMVLDQVDDADSTSQLSQHLNTIVAGAAAKTQITRDQYLQNKANGTLGGGTPLNVNVKASPESIKALEEQLNTAKDELSKMSVSDMGFVEQTNKVKALEEELKQLKALAESIGKVSTKINVMPKTNGVMGGLSGQGATSAMAKQAGIEAKGVNTQIKIDIEVSDAKKKLEELKKAQQDIYNGSMSAASGIVSLGSSFSNLSKSISDGIDSFDDLMNVLSGVIGIVQTINSIMTAFNTISKATTTITAANAAAHEANADASLTDAGSAAADTIAKGIESTAAKADATAQMTDAAAKVMNAHSWIPYVGVAIGGAMVGALIATMLSLPKFETGGIVGGNSYSGDKILARLNSGEGVITRKGLSNLESAFGDGNIRQNSGRVEFKIKDSELYGILSNYETKKARRV